MRKRCIQTYKDLWFDLPSQVVVGFSLIHLSDWLFVGAPSNQPSMSNDSLECWFFAFSIIAALLLKLLVVEAWNVNRRNWVNNDWFEILNI